MNATENPNGTLPPDFPRLQKMALTAGVVGLLLCAVGLFTDPKQFFHSWLLGFTFWLGIALGSLSLLMLHHLFGGSWGFVIQRILETSARMLPLMAVAALPLFFGLRELYPWADPQNVAHEALLRHKAPYLNVAFFMVRAAIYFAVWLGLAHFLCRWSEQQDRTGDPALCTALSRRMQIAAAPGLLLYGLTITFASVDWVMSLEPEWFSTIYGVLFMVGQALAAMALTVRLLARLADRPPLADVVAPSHFHDLGNLMLAFTMLWAYVSFSQFLIIWSGNLPEEIPWYLTRTRGGWQFVALSLAGFHFVLPFLLLLIRIVKRRPQSLARLALVILIMRLVDLFWLIAPAHHRAGLHVHWLDIAAPVGIGGVFMAALIWQLGKRSLLPLNDPGLAAAFEHRHEAPSPNAHGEPAT